MQGLLHCSLSLSIRTKSTKLFKIEEMTSGLSLADKQIDVQNNDATATILVTISLIRNKRIVKKIQRSEYSLFHRKAMGDSF